MVQTALVKKQKEKSKRSFANALRVFEERLNEMDTTHKAWLEEIKLMRRILRQKVNE